MADSSSYSIYFPSMINDENFKNDSNYRKKLFAVTDIMNDSKLGSKRKPMPSVVERSFPRYHLGIDCDEVFPGIVVGNVSTAKNKLYLKGIGITHVLNCAMDTDSAPYNYYQDVGIRYKGLQLEDHWKEDIAQYFEEAANYIHDAVLDGGKVLIHCMAGISRSATITAAYLMLRHNHTVEKALKTIRHSRPVRPNEGFIRQLVLLDSQIQSGKYFDY